MQLVSFLSGLEKNSLYAHPFICFTGTESLPILFVSVFLERLRNVHHYSVHTIDSNNFSFEGLLEQSSMSFLGQQSLYWLGNLQSLDTKNRQKCMQYCAQYQGPNTLIAFNSDTTFFSRPDAIVELPAEVNFALYVKLAGWLYPEYKNWDKGFSKQVFSLHTKIPLDTALLLMHYQRVLGGQVDSFFSEWFESIVMPESSLFMLSSLLFAKDAQKFFHMWVTIKDTYPLPFWIAFWSEQVFRAYHFIGYKKSKQLLHAKKIAYRLPYSFIQKDWMNVSLDSLQQIHHMMYELDFRYKNGASELYLDHVFGLFFV